MQKVRVFIQPTAEDYFVGDYFTKENKDLPAKSEIEEAYRTCKNMTEAASKMKMAVQTFRKYMKLYGIEIAKRGGYRRY